MSADSEPDRTAAFALTCTLPGGWTAADLADDLRGLLAEFRPDAQLDWKVSEVDSPALREKRDRVIQAILDKVRQSLQGRKVSLSYADRNDALRPEQVRVLLRGENPYESREFSMLEESESDQRYEAAIEEIKDILSAEEYALLDTDADAMDEARFAVYDADESDLITEILKNTGPMLLRYDLGVDVSTDWTSDESDREQMKSEIVDALALPEDHPVRAHLDELLTEGQAGRLYVIWSAYPSHVIDEVWPLQKPRMGDDVPKATITWNRPPGLYGAELLILDSLNGTGYSVALGAPLTVPFDAENLTTDDKSGGYGWNDVAGVVRSAYEATIDVEILTWASAGTDEPRDQVADSMRHAGWYAIGPERTEDDRWSVTYCWNENDTTHELDLGRDWRGEIVAKRQAEKHERSHTPKEA